ncbi:hypothetical protein [Streptomyces sp. NPDC060333]|uniref:hypothetical protein n=1 Tax=Streptomyces sp. NPDC060333 TaxID=3347098 RepID=UPI00365FD3BD
MTHNFGFHFTQELGNQFDTPTDSWPASTEQVTPFFAIIADALGTNGAVRWFEAARRAYQSASQVRTYNFGFAHYLDLETEAHEDPTLPVVAAFEATKALYEVTRRDADVFFECARRACSRSSAQPSSRPMQQAAAAPAGLACYTSSIRVPAGSCECCAAQHPGRRLQQKQQQGALHPSPQGAAARGEQSSTMVLHLLLPTVDSARAGGSAPCTPM